MSFIPKQDKTPKAKLQVHLRQDVADEAKQYSDYLESDMDHVVEQLLLKAFRSDKGYQNASRGEESVALPTAGKGRSRKADIAAGSATAGKVA